MGMSAGSSRGGVKNDINVTPMVDIVLVLLIIFMVVTPMLQRGKDVNLPKSQTSEKKDATKEEDPLILSVTRDEKVFLETDEYDTANLERKLKEEITSAPSRKILLKGDLALNYGKIREVMEVARKAGAKGIALGVEAEKEN